MPGRPETGIGHYLRDIIIGAGDGIITTFAVVAGATGADLPLQAALILGAANLVADGISMGVGQYLGLVSELDQRGEPRRHEKPARHGLATGLAFALIGIAPLLAYLTPPDIRLAAAASVALIALFLVGAARARFVPRSWLRSGSEMAALGGIAGAAAYAVGVGLAGVLGGG